MQEDVLEAAPEFPTLSQGVTLLTAEQRTTGPLQSLVLDHLLVSGGEALWVDSRNNATTQSLAQVAPSRRVLQRVQVARAFTAFQHHSIIEDVPGQLTPDVSLLVAPAVDWFYAEDDLWRGEGEEMLHSALDQLETIATDASIPILVTSSPDDTHSDIIAEHTDQELACELTQFGPRFSGSDFETLVFECQTGLQTTLAFWRRVLQARHDTEFEQAQPEVAHVGSD